MRRRFVRPESQPVSLFPFLAVLICTFGVLIVLLVIVVKAASQQNKVVAKESREAAAEQLEQLQSELELQAIRFEGLLSLRPDLLATLKSERNRRARLQHQIREIAEDNLAVQEQLDRIAAEDNSQSTATPEQLPTAIADLERQLVEQQRLLAERRSSAAAPPAKYSVVPHDGPDGTRRRPIYVECRADRITIEPYGIELKKEDFVEPIVANNPLDAALVAVREYFLANGLGDAGETPYPLLIVRPDGPSSYVMARRAIRSWDEEFGYELIDSDTELDFGEADPQLQQELEAAIERARQRQSRFVAERALVRAANSGRTGSQMPVGLRASSQHGGFVRSNGSVMQASASLPDTDHGRLQASGDPANSSRSDSESAGNPDIELQSLDNTTSIAERRGKDWALHGKTENSTGYLRPLTIMVGADRITIESDSHSSRRIEIPIGDNMRVATEALVQAIWQRIESWGVAGVGGYWKPELNPVLLPGGDNRLRQLRQLLTDSGLQWQEGSR